MKIAGIFLLFMLFTGGFAASQALFYALTGRLYWRAFCPTQVRFSIKTKDKVKFDSFMAVEEYSAVILLGSFLLLPIIAMNSIGFVSFF